MQQGHAAGVSTAQWCMCVCVILAIPEQLLNCRSSITSGRRVFRQVDPVPLYRRIASLFVSSQVQSPQFASSFLSQPERCCFVPQGLCGCVGGLLHRRIFGTTGCTSLLMRRQQWCAALSHMTLIYYRWKHAQRAVTVAGNNLVLFAAQSLWHNC